MQTPTTSQLFLGIDPSLTCSGIAFLRGDICKTYVSIPGPLRGGERLFYHIKMLRKLLSEFGVITAACIEGPSLESDSSHSDELGQIRGSFLCALAEVGIKTYEPLPPTSVKKFATGVGHASKEMMLKHAMERWPKTTFETHDAADASWMAAVAEALTLDIPVTAYQLEVLRTLRMPKAKTKKQRTQSASNI